MNIRRQQLAIDLLNIIMRFIPVYLFISIILYRLDSRSASLTLLLLPAPMLSYLIRKYTHHIWSFVIFHGIIFAVYLLLIRNLYLITVFSIYLILLTIVAYYRKNKINELENSSSLLLIPIVMLYIACYLIKMSELQQLCFLLSVVYTILYIANRYLINLERFVYNHEGMTNLPFLQIRNSNNVIIVFLISLFLVVMFAFSMLPLDRLIMGIGRFIIRLLRFLISLIQFKEPEDVPEPEEEDVMIEDLPITEPSPLMEFILQVLEWVATLLVVVFIVAVILYTLYQIYQYFYLKSEKTLRDKVEFLSPFVQRERIQRERKRRFRSLFGRSNNAQIRKYFTQAVASNLTPDTKLDKSLTPSQLSEYILILPEAAPDENQNKKQQITTYYEKARYSNEDCSKDEVQLLKKLLKEKS